MIGSLGQAQSNSAALIAPVAVEALDTPNTASATTYMTKLKNSDNVTTVTFPFNSGTAELVLQELMG